MTSPYPGGYDALAKPVAATLQNEAGFQHDVLHASVARAVEAVQQALGLNLANVAKPADLTALRNATVNLIDAAGDLLIGSAPDTLARLAKGADGTLLGVTAGSLAWINDVRQLVDAAGDILVASGDNTLVRLPKGADGTVLSTTAGAVGWAAPVVVEAMSLIGTATPASGTTTFTFSSIPQTYRSLYLIGHVRTLDAFTSSAALLRFNGDTTTSYGVQNFQASGTTVSGSSNAAVDHYPVSSTAANASAGLVAGMELVIPGYAVTNIHKVFHGRSGFRTTTSGSGNAASPVGFWAKNEAIASITLSNTAGFATGTTISLYGIKG